MIKYNNMYSTNKVGEAEIPTEEPAEATIRRAPQQTGGEAVAPAGEVEEAAAVGEPNR